jgi:hypothetical protein
VALRALAYDDSPVTSAGQLAQFIAKYSPEVARVAKAALVTLRKRFVGTQELVYDNYNALAIGWSPTGKVSHVICSIALYPRWVSLFFMQGTLLPDPTKRLEGGGKGIRHVVLENGAATLAEADVKKLLAAAIDRAIVAPIGTAPPVTIIKSISAKQRPRRPDGPDRSKTRSAPPRSSRTPAAGRASAARRTRAPRARTGR